VTDNGGTTYRFATAGTGTVEQTLTTTGTLEPVRRADVDFQVAGTVSRVIAKQGDHVKAGATLARLDRSALRASLDDATSTLRKDTATLTDDEDGQSSSATGNNTATTTSSQGSTTSTGSASSPGTASVGDAAFESASTRPIPTATPTPTRSGSSGSLTARIKRDQQAVVKAQRQTDAEMATAKSDLAAESTACAAEVAGTSTPASTTACTNAATTLLTDQTAVSTDEQAVAKAETTLTNDLGSLAASLATPSRSGTSTAPSSSGQSTSSQRSATSSSGSSSSTSSTTTHAVSASTLASDQARIDTDRASVAVDRASLDQGVLRSSITGRVAAVSVTKGSRVSGSSSSSSPAFEIVGSHQSKVTIGLTAAQVRTVKLGMSARVSPDGSTTTAAGSVTKIGVTATSSTTDSSATYPVTVGLPSPPTGVVAGAEAEVTIVLATADRVLSVATSAVHQSGSSFSVREFVAGKLVSRTIHVGARGPALTQVTSGLVAGQRVVLADLDTAVPSSSTNLTNTRRAGVGGPGAGGFGAGGFGAGGFGAGGTGGVSRSGAGGAGDTGGAR
jgi:HlyD family secretion protein